MADIQKQFEQYHDKIKLTDENQVLRDKRDKLKQNLEDNLPTAAPKIEKYLLQGSYAIYTGINPPNNDYDIDVGIVFDCTRDDYSPMKLKEMVRDALEHKPTRIPVVKNPCITVQYHEDGEDAYHVDMPIYVKRKDNNEYDLAWGKSSSSEEWKLSSPEELVETINDKFDDKKRSQFRRVVKYLKAWKSKKITDFNVPSIGITLGIWKEFDSNLDNIYEERPNDLLTMRNTIKKMVEKFVWIGLDDQNENLYRDQVELPVTPHNDVFEKLTKKQMTVLKNKLEMLVTDLTNAYEEERLEKSCEILGKHFDGFPTVPLKDTAKAVVRSMNNTGSSS